MKSIEYRAYNNKLKLMRSVANIDFIRRTITIIAARSEAGIAVQVWPATDTQLLMQLPYAKTEKEQPIFEGDIVRCHIKNEFGSMIEEYAVIVFAGSSFIMQGVENAIWGDASPENIIANEVVGNALENPDLLQKHHLIFIN